MIDTGNKRFSEKAPDIEQVLNLEEIKSSNLIVETFAIQVAVNVVSKE